VFPSALSPHHEGAKQDTIGVGRGVSAKLSHYTDPALIYLMENEMPFVHHIVERWGCNYTNEDNKGLSEKDPMTSNVKTQIQVDASGKGIKEAIGLG
jgi:hypothetical protein